MTISVFPQIGKNTFSEVILIVIVATFNVIEVYPSSTEPCVSIPILPPLNVFTTFASELFILTSPDDSLLSEDTNVSHASLICAEIPAIALVAIFT